jgi:hypothetical protein
MIKTYIAVISLVLLPRIVLADGFPGIEGENSKGVHISIYEEHETTVDMDVSYEINGKRIVLSYHDEPCDASSDHIDCKATGKSPLAGTRYVGRKANGSCENGDPQIIYTCVSGCDKSPEPPRILTLGYWEC